MKRLALFLIPLAAFVVLAVFLLRGLWLNPREIPSPLIGKPAPVFARPTLHAPDQTFASADMLGQVWLLNTWASWCTPCRQEHPLWNAFALKKMAPLVGLNYKDRPENALRWLGELGDPYQLNVVDADGSVGLDYGVYGVPETFLIDKKGVIRYKHIGPITQEALDTKIVPLLQQLKNES